MDEVAGLNEAAAQAASALELKHAARERALSVSRGIVRRCANAIRSIHRHELQAAGTALDEVGDELKRLADDLHGHPDIYWSGYVQDSLKEYAEACITLALVQRKPVPGPVALGVDAAPYLNGLGEAVGELRRHALDVLRVGAADQAEYLLDAMSEVYEVLVTVDYPDTLTGGLRRTTDGVRGILERTRGDITLALRQERLERALRRAGG